MGIFNRTKPPQADDGRDYDVFVEWEGQDVLVEPEPGETDDEAAERTLRELENVGTADDLLDD